VTTTEDPQIEVLIEQARQGDLAARQRLLERCRARLRRAVAVRLDRRLSARVDASDVVQEALAEASRRLDDYLLSRPLPLLIMSTPLRCDASGRLREPQRISRAVASPRHPGHGPGPGERSDDSRSRDGSYPTEPSPGTM
jgi:DNA-directed RNA polymerase specialized sigma24 family protein